jgi:glycosyltransferase involved in cell wall biosynthesis
VDPLLRQTGLDYLLLISGKRLIPRLQQRIVGSPTIRYVNFIPDINGVYQGCDLFVNPVTNDSGVKTKVIEALANGCKVVSTVAGAAGIPEHVAGEQLVKVKDGDWPAFVAAVTNALAVEKISTPASFFEYFSWTNIAAKAAAHIQEVIRQ